ncbi:MAG: amidohydrolase family protein, partial [Planctomycetota bacterium]|nr:amidohydrolase family protein [Planctomycetota bacterium]
MSNKPTGTTRRSAIKTIGALGAAAAIGTSGTSEAAAPASEDRAAGFARELQLRIQQTPLVDTHEHLPDEDERLRGQQMACDDWALLFSHYANDDWISAGMSDETHRQLLARNVDPATKWQLLAPFWPAVKNTGYSRAVRIAIRELYGIDQLDAAAIGRLQDGYESMRKAGFYRKILVDLAKIESCQVNSLGNTPFKESKQPTLLMQDLSILGMHMGPDIKRFAPPTGKKVQDLADWHEVIGWWFDKYALYAVAVKSQAAYSRGLDFDQVPAEQAAAVFKKVLASDPILPQEKKLLEDHLFWYAVRKATEFKLPVKLHTGYYAGQNNMLLDRLSHNPGSAANLCRRAPDTRFVFMHICYPYYEELLAVAKHYANAYIDMCWSW